MEQFSHPYRKIHVTHSTSFTFATNVAARVAAHRRRAPCGAALRPAGRAYVTNEDGESVSVLDTDKAEVVATMNVGKRPRGLKLSHDGKQLFVAVSGLPKCPPSVPDEECAKLKRDLTADGIAVIDTATLKLTKIAEVRLGSGAVRSQPRRQAALHCERRLRDAHRGQCFDRGRGAIRAGGKGAGRRARDAGRAMDSWLPAK